MSSGTITGKTIGLGLHTAAYTFSSDSYTVTNLGSVSVTSPVAIDFLGSADTLIIFGAVTGAYGGTGI